MKTKIELSEEIKLKLSEAVLLWKDEYLVGKPEILAIAMYSSLISVMEDKTNEINKRFKKEKL